MMRMEEIKKKVSNSYIEESDEERMGIPMALSFRSVKVADFGIYAGSRQGAVLQDLCGVCPSDFWADEISEIESLYKNIMLLFYNDGWLKVMPYKDTFRYRQKCDAIEIYVEERKAWIPFACGTKEQLTLKLGLVYYGKFGLFKTTNKRMLNCDETCWSAFHYAGISSMSLMKDRRLKIAWCNMHYIFY